MFRPGVVDQNESHRLRGGGEEMHPIGECVVRPSGEFQVRFVHQRSRPRSVSAPLTTQISLKTAVHPRQPRPALMCAPPRAVLRNHPLGEARNSCAAQWNWASRATPPFPTAGFRINSRAAREFRQHGFHQPRLRVPISAAKLADQPCAFPESLSMYSRFRPLCLIFNQAKRRLNS